MNGEENGGLIPQESLTSQFVEERDLPFNMEAEQAVLGSALKGLVECRRCGGAA